MTCKKQNFDYIIKRNDTFPPILYNLPECEEINLDQQEISVTASMWSNSNLAFELNDTNINIKLKNNYNISTVSVDDYILIKKNNFFEYFKVVSINSDELEVLRAQLGSVARNWQKSNQIKIIKIFDIEAEKQILYNDSINLNGQTENIVSSQNLIYNWADGDTSSPGEYFLEFKVSKIKNGVVEWTKKFPGKEEGIKVQIIDNNLEI